MQQNNLDSQVLIITATYNEAENIKHLINEIHKIGPNFNILVVDDNSPDGTGEIVAKLSKSNNTVHLLSRKGKLGYGSAFIEGFSWGLANKNFNYFISMDADFSHQPQHIKQMLEQLNSADVIIGSRYIPEGGTRNWGIHRKILSLGANIYSRLILNVSVNDCTSGFRCYKRHVLENIDLSKITSNGYSFLEEILYYCKLQNIVFKEIPIIFKNRKYGKSKINKNEIIKAIFKTPALRLFPKKPLKKNKT